MSDAIPISVTVVIPVYRGAETLRGVVEELAALTAPTVTPDGHTFTVLEVVPVWDNGPDESDLVISELSADYPWVRPVWLSRNFGQHPATVAGIAASRGDWVVTMDEDGQHDPADLARLLDTALRERAALVYAAPVNEAPHSAFRNTASALTKGVVLRALTGPSAVPFHSLRLIHGEHARAVAAYCGPGVYLDIALTWIISSIATCPVKLRLEGRAAEGYSLRRLLSHFWRLVLSSGNRPLRLVSGLGVVTALLGIVYAVVVVIERATATTEVAGWTSLMVVVLIVGGLTLLSLGVIAEYVGLAAGMSMGRPLYVTTSDAFVRVRNRSRSAR